MSDPSASSRPVKLETLLQVLQEGQIEVLKPSEFRKVVGEPKRDKKP